MNPVSLFTECGTPVTVPRNIKVMCTARHPQTNEMVILKEQCASYLFHRTEANPVYQGSLTELPTVTMLDPIEVATELTLVVSKAHSATKAD